MPDFEHDGWRLAYEEQGDGPPLLLLHGLLMDHTVLAPQIEALKGSYRVITPDLRGHGGSEHRSEDRTLWDLMEDQIALLDALRVESAVWGGHSVAGPISLRAALRYPDRVAGLVLISTQAGAEHASRLAPYEAFADLVGTQGWTEEALNGIAASYFGRSAPKELKEHWIERWRAQDTTDVPQVMRALTRRESLLDHLDKVKVPSLVIYGDEDVTALRLEEVELMVAALPLVSEFLRIPKAGHTPTLEQPTVTTAALLRFLDGLPPSLRRERAAETEVPNLSPETSDR